MDILVVPTTKISILKIDEKLFLEEDLRKMIRKISFNFLDTTIGSTPR